MHFGTHFVAVTTVVIIVASIPVMTKPQQQIKWTYPDKMMSLLSLSSNLSKCDWAQVVRCSHTGQQAVLHQ